MDFKPFKVDDDYKPMSARFAFAFVGGAIIASLTFAILAYNGVLP